MEEHIVASGIVHTNKSKRQLPETKEDPELLGHKLLISKGAVHRI